jgi:GntR family transcriptional regulator, transcriptional repressor for pyruvate dehydrogenase complex
MVVTRAKAAEDYFARLGQQLAKLLDEIGSEPSVDQLIANDLEFHRIVAEASGNLVLSSLVDGLSAPTQRARVWRGLTQGDAWQRTWDEHRAVYDALAAGQPDLARSWMTVHVSGVEHWLRSAL